MERVKGVRYYTPEEERTREKIINVIKEVYESYGYLPIDTPAFEPLAELVKKAGEEIKEQLFLIQGEEIALRFDLTVPLARFMHFHKEMHRPFKRYHIGKVWRNEESQRGRFREFIQADADIVGVEGIEAEKELIEMAEIISRKLGLKAKLSINDRRWVEEFLREKGLEERKEEIMRIIDKLDRFGREEVEKMLKEKDADEAIEILKVGERDEKEKLEFISAYSDEAGKNLSEIKDEFPEFVKISLTLVRGLEYYTSTVFEIKCEEFPYSIGGGGRYNDLLSLYGVKDVACGLSFGVDRILSFYPKEQMRWYDVYIIPLGKEERREAKAIARELREAGIRVGIALKERNLKREVEYASQTKTRFLIVLGKNELESQIIKIKMMDEYKEIKAKRGKICETIKELLSSRF